VATYVQVMPSEAKNEVTPSPAVAVISDLDALSEQLVERLTEAMGLMNIGHAVEPYWTAEEAAAYLACDRQRIYDLRSEGRLKCVKDGSRVLTRRSWIDNYLKENE
jgi:excisionase family DNA binding protein